MLFNHFVMFIICLDADETNDDGARSAASSMSVDLELFENNGQRYEENLSREEVAEQTVVENPVQSSEIVSEAMSSKPLQVDSTMEMDGEKGLEDRKG